MKNDKESAYPLSRTHKHSLSRKMEFTVRDDIITKPPAKFPIKVFYNVNIITFHLILSFGAEGWIKYQKNRSTFRSAKLKTPPMYKLHLKSIKQSSVKLQQWFQFYFRCYISFSSVTDNVYNDGISVGRFNWLDSIAEFRQNRAQFFRYDFFFIRSTFVWKNSTFVWILK